MKKEYLTTTEAAEFIGRTPSAIRNLVMRRMVPFRKPGGRLMFLRSELIDWIESAPGLSLDEIDEAVI
jgi:excisionase family DNA binding protein